MRLPKAGERAGFQISNRLAPCGDQPEAIASILEGMNAGCRFQTLLGATGTGKTFTIANVIQEIQRPTLIIAHNKTLTAQLCSELRELFPDNAVHYFVSYYDYYQPEAYMPQTDTYIEKDSSINDEIDRLRHAATSSLFERRDVIIVASVSCIYGLGSPDNYHDMSLTLSRGETRDRDDIMRSMIQLQYTRNEIGFERGTFRARGDTLEIIPAYEEKVIRLEFFGDEIDRIAILDPITGHPIRDTDDIHIYPASHFITPTERLEQAVDLIGAELEERLKQFRESGRLLEAQRIEQRTRYDIEMIQEMGYCSGIENYSRHLDGRREGQPPSVLIDYFPSDFLLVVDESHQTVPQIRGMYHGDRSRKTTLVDYGFRMPSALDNRPLTFIEFEERIHQVVFMSAISGLCVTTRTILSLLVNCLRISRMRSPVVVSKFPVGSSARIIVGSLTSERAMATRCCSPPDNLEGR